jgi:hypothetical protein
MQQWWAQVEYEKSFMGQKLVLNLSSTAGWFRLLGLTFRTERFNIDLSIIPDLNENKIRYTSNKC